MGKKFDFKLGDGFFWIAYEKGTTKLFDWSHKTRPGIKKDPTDPIAACDALCKIVIGAINVRVTDIMFFHGFIGYRSKRKNIFKLNAVSNHEDSKKHTIKLFPIIDCKTKSLEVLKFTSGDSYLVTRDMIKNKWRDLPCGECIRYTHCSVGGNVTYNNFEIDQCPGFSRRLHIGEDEKIEDHYKGLVEETYGY